MPTRHSSLKSNNCNALSPARQGLTRLPRPLGQGDVLAGPVSVARVRSRTSKGITAISPVSPVHRTPGSLDGQTLRTPAGDSGPPAPRLIGSHCGSLVTQGISTYLKPLCGITSSPPLSARCDGLALPRLATGSTPGASPRRSLYQVVLPASRH